MDEQNPKSILLADDDFDLCQLLTEYLKTKGFTVWQAHDGLSALELIRTAELVDLMILDVMMPLMDGFQVLAEIRKTEITIPIIMLTAKGEPDDRIAGLELGADDYLTKPFEPRELLARIQAIIRRTNLNHEPVNSKAVSVLTIDNLELNANTYQALSKGKTLHLTPVEFRLLWLLAIKPGEVVSRETLFLQALGREENPFDRSLDIHISRLRKKLGPRPDGSDRLKSIRGEGYLYALAFDLNI